MNYTSLTNEIPKIHVLSIILIIYLFGISFTLQAIIYFDLTAQN